MTSVVSSSGSSSLFSSVLVGDSSVGIITLDSFDNEMPLFSKTESFVFASDTTKPAPITAKAAETADDEDHQEPPPDQASFFFTCE